LKIIIVASAQSRGDTLSGADRIFIECARRWTQKGNSIQIITCEEGYEMCQRYALKKATYLAVSSNSRLPLYLRYVVRMIKGNILTWRMASNATNSVVYSSSDFWPDAIPAWIMKMRFKGVMWVAGFYLFSPNPFGGGTPYRGKATLRGLLYYMSQFPIYYLVRRYADMVFVTNELDRKKFIDNRLTPGRVIAVRGGVDVSASNLVAGSEKKRFDAVFIGRLHPQKGVLELIDVWRFVCRTKTDAKLAIIGVGELKEELTRKIKNYGLEGNIVLFGFKDGVEKLRIFKDSKIVVHPAIYDSGGMGACEAMACGLPGVSFDLPALRTYYPKGMLKTPCFDLAAFANNILKLLNDQEIYREVAREALDWAKGWDWDKRAKELLTEMQKVS
jgi:glycosyltransferase involved in cell wall biosynthesis